MNTSYQRTSGKTVGHSFGGCRTGNTPGSALLYIFSTFIHHTSQRGNETEFPNKYYLNNYLLHLRENNVGYEICIIGRMCYLKLNHHKSSGWYSSQFGEKGT
ncbi:hypothetical protein V1477_021034 [Vespula maculifrons]|uniref:Uncharacterized protein n=1 Tax=Vespula maculifrons TaxID=7453 RepID=A0ABD2AHX6_VESMC